ncbi:MAG: TrkH family potassium uptake protein [Bacteroidales bacterium]|nr:TrkH family potassium uptake protein [Bacteroidales bacterium]
MNTRFVVKILGRLLLLEGFFMLLSVVFSLIYHDGVSLKILLSAGITMGFAVIIIFSSREKSKNIGKKEGVLVVSLSWILFSFFGTLPFILTGAIPSLTDAFFETISGFTTTGASILNNIEALPASILFWRSMTQWLGGMGIIVLSLAILPLLGIGGIQLFIAEVPGPKPDKLHPSVRETAKRLWAIYLGFTLTEMVMLMLGGMSFFDAINHSLTTMATGGYSTKQASIAAWSSPYIHYVITFFMMVAGTNFTMAYFALKGRTKKIWKNEEFKVYIGFLLGFTILFTLVLALSRGGGLEHNFRDAAFQVVSIMTTTGYVTADYLAWVPILGVLLLILMFFGGSAGSTGGGMKIIRVWLTMKNSYLELKRVLHPNAIIPIRYNKRAVSEKITSNILNFVVLYMIIFIVGVLVMASLGLDLPSSMGSVAACLGNIGPGIGSVGPMENFSQIPEFGKWFLGFLMLMGRLELFTVIVLLSPVFWKK